MTCSNADNNWQCSSSWTVPHFATTTAETYLFRLAILALAYSCPVFQPLYRRIWRTTTWQIVAWLVQPAFLWQREIWQTGWCTLVFARPGLVADGVLPYLVLGKSYALIGLVVRMIALVVAYAWREFLVARWLASVARWWKGRRRGRRGWSGFIVPWCLFTLFWTLLLPAALTVERRAIDHQTSSIWPLLTPEYLLLEARTRLQSAEPLQTLHLAQKTMFCDLSYMTLYCSPTFRANFANSPSEHLAQTISCQSPAAPPAGLLVTDDFARCNIIISLRHRLAHVITAYEDWNAGYYTPLRQLLDSTHHSLGKLPPPNLYDNMFIAPLPTTEMGNGLWFCFRRHVLQILFGARWEVMRWLFAHAEAAAARRQMSEVRRTLRVFANESVTGVWARMDWGADVVKSMQKLRSEHEHEHERSMVMPKQFRTLRRHALGVFRETPGPDIAVEAFLEHGFGKKTADRFRRELTDVVKGAEGEVEEDEEGLLALLCEFERWEGQGGWLAGTTWQGDEAWRQLMDEKVLEIQQKRYA